MTIRQDFDKLGPNKFKYDGIVVDDLPLHKWDPEELIALTDTSCDTAINVKYGTGLVQKGSKIIICGDSVADIINEKWPENRKEAIKRRCRFYMFDDTPLYSNAEEDVRNTEIIYFRNCVAGEMVTHFNE